MIFTHKHGLPGEAILSPPDARDYFIAPGAVAKAIPDKWGKNRRVKIVKQRVNSCFNQALAYAYECATGVQISKGGVYADREPHHYQGEGRIMREGLETAYKHGTCEKKYYDYEYEVPKAQSHLQGMLDYYRAHSDLFKLESYARAYSETEIKTALMNASKGYGVIFAGACPSFKTDKNHIFRMDSPVYGYHGMAVTDFNRSYGECPQSWGTSFGNKGYCFVPFSDILRLNDAWILKFKMPSSKQEKEDAPNLIDRTLRKGMKGEDVKKLQNALLDLGYDLGKYGADGDFGTATYNAVRQFQKTKGLTADGIAGKATLGALYA